MNDVLQDALEGIDTANFEFPLFSKDGKRVDILLNASPRQDADGNVVGVVGVGQNITSRRAEKLKKEAAEAAEHKRDQAVDDLKKLIGDKFSTKVH